MILTENVSVIIPTWNRAATIEKAVRSALGQTLPPKEVLVCDDGSTDNSRDVVQTIDDPRVKWIEGPHSGRPAVPRNRGIAVARGEWLAFLDSDDEWLLEKLNKQLLLVKKLDCRAVCSNAFRYIPRKGIDRNKLEWDGDRICFEDLLLVNQIICSSTMFHRSLLSVTEGFAEAAQLIVGEDYALWLRVATQTDFAYIKDPLLVYCDDPENSVRSKGSDVWTQRMKVLTDFHNWGGMHDIPSIYLRKAEIQFLKTLLQSNKAKIHDFVMLLKRSFF